MIWILFMISLLLNLPRQLKESSKLFYHGPINWQAFQKLASARLQRVHLQLLSHGLIFIFTAIKPLSSRKVACSLFSEAFGENPLM